MMNAAWGLLSFACIVAMRVVGFALQWLVSYEASLVAICAGAGAVFFCLAGCANTLWRRDAILPEARRLAGAAPRDAYEAALHRTLPPNSSVFAQAAVGILAAVITAVNL